MLYLKDKNGVTRKILDAEKAFFRINKSSRSVLNQHAAT